MPNALLHFVFHLRVGIKVACETCNLATNAPTTDLNARVCNQVGLYPTVLKDFKKPKATLQSHAHTILGVFIQ